jgi:dihydrofolate reductase
MGKLIYNAITSLDLYTNDTEGNFDWAAPDPDVHQHVNDINRGIGLYLLGRKSYEAMIVWDTMEGDTPIEKDFAHIWRAADKIVFSRSLATPLTARTTIEHAFEPPRIRQLKAETAGSISIGGARLAAEALVAGLVDEVELYLNPIIVGGGTPALPDSLWQRLELMDQHAFDSGVVFLRYRGAAEPGA